jgi:hypothetical protein
LFVKALRMHCREPSNSPPLEEEEEEGVVREEIA